MTENGGPETILCPALKINKKNGEPVRRTADAAGLIDHGAKPFADGNDLYIPLTEMPSEELLSEIAAVIADAGDPTVEAVTATFEARPEELTVARLIGRAPTYEMIGDIAIIDGKDADDASLIADAILKVHRTIRTVLLSEGPVKGEFRTRDLTVVAGIPTTKTVHKEYGCRYHIDLEKAYFTQRLSTERARILSLIEDGAFVADMFAGVGPFSILIAKNRKNATVAANDKNPEAVRLLKENIRENKTPNVIPSETDAKDLGEMYAGQADHVLMNLPHNACDFLDIAVTLCKPGGVIHYYAMTEETDLYDGSANLIEKAASAQNRTTEVIGRRSVRSYAPHQYNICLDVRVF